MAGKRDYGQFCGLAAGLTVIGERWTMLILRELLIGPARFNELPPNLPGIGPNLLAERLRTLIEHGVIEQHAVPGDGRGKQYRLTERGEQLREPILALAHWGMQFLSEEDSAGISRAEWGFLAVQAMISTSDLPDRDESYEFRVGDRVFTVEVADGQVHVRRGSGELPPAIVVGADPETFIRIGARMLSPFDAIITGGLTIDGDPDAIQRCVRMLRLSTTTDG
ncbi:transcriptional regulator [Saccharopolyspora elongata]|uniref:Transcriptional regulator n=2 Tax=Saccharopolyspora elongata TaxID=2530387 RepID=A0A4V2YNT5_9PSEU|nr:transcriptional regulator [Saccharopolyspora elongata]